MALYASVNFNGPSRFTSVVFAATLYVLLIILNYPHSFCSTKMKSRLLLMQVGCLHNFAELGKLFTTIEISTCKNKFRFFDHKSSESTEWRATKYSETDNRGVELFTGNLLLRGMVANRRVMAAWVQQWRRTVAPKGNFIHTNCVVVAFYVVDYYFSTVFLWQHREKSNKNVQFILNGDSLLKKTLLFHFLLLTILF